jgi:radical SAM protein with 4Fe4S-binding SPASM domain
MDLDFVPKLEKTTLYDEMKKKRWLHSCDFEITSTCNLRCVHCYLGHLTDTSSQSKKELSTEEIKKIIVDLADHGCLFLLITGGEPLTRKDFKEIYEFAIKKNFVLTLFTNGTLLTSDLISFFKNQPPDQIELTVYGMTEKTYESITQIPGSYNRFWNGLNMLVESDLPLALKTVILTLNEHEIFSFKKYCDERNIKCRFTPTINSRFDLNNNPANYQLPAERAADLIYNLIDDKKSLVKNSFQKNKYCSAGVLNCYINSVGEISACTLLSADKKRVLNLREMPLDYAWNNLSTRPPWPHHEKCTNCKAFKMCFQCAAESYLESGKEENISEFRCRFTIEIYKKIYGNDPF